MASTCAPRVGARQTAATPAATCPGASPWSPTPTA